MNKKTCEVYYFSDMQKCMKCGASWDANDPHPPICDFDKPANVRFIDRVIAFIFGDKAE